ncbi:MAG: hypothetical protein AAB432_00110 [Patescibacteria group bacterium]
MDHFRRKILIEISIASAVIIALFVGIFLFVSNIQSNTDKIIDLRNTLTQKSLSLERFTILNKQYTDKAKNYLTSLQNVVPTRDKLINISKDFQNITVSTGLNYGFTLGNEAPATNENLGSIGFQLNLGGDLWKLVDFLPQLPRFHYLTMIDNLTLGGRDSSEQMNITGRVFFR